MKDHIIKAVKGPLIEPFNCRRFITTIDLPLHSKFLSVIEDKPIFTFIVLSLVSEKKIEPVKVYGYSIYIEEPFDISDKDYVGTVSMLYATIAFSIFVESGYKLN